MWVLKSAEAKPPRSVHRLDEPTGLSSAWLRPRIARFRFARQNRCSVAATSGANFRMRRNPDKAAHFDEGATDRQLNLDSRLVLRNC